MPAALKSRSNYAGLALFAYGFRPFFLVAALWAAFNILLWLPQYLSRLISDFNEIGQNRSSFKFGNSRVRLVRTKLLHKILVAQCVAALTVGNLIFGTTAYAQMDPKQQRGLTFARANCARCHSIDKVTESPLKLAPPFRELHNRYPVETLEEALGEGIVTGHPNMPEFRLDPGQIGDLISYLKWLER